MFDFTEQEYELIKKKAMLNEELSQILEMKIKGYSITKMALELHTSESTISRRVKKLKKKLMKVLWQEVDNLTSFFYAIMYLKGEK